jgi:hypothetical protein
MTARAGTQPPPPSERKRLRPTETDHWKVEKDSANPNDKKKDEWRPTKGGYRKPPPVDVPEGFNELNIWIQDMTEWGIMMQEAVDELRERVGDLETRP